MRWLDYLTSAFRGPHEAAGESDVFNLTGSQAQFVAAWLAGTLSDYGNLMAPEDAQAMRLILSVLPFPPPAGEGTTMLASLIIQELGSAPQGSIRPRS